MAFRVTVKNSMTSHQFQARVCMTFRVKRKNSMTSYLQCVNRAANLQTVQWREDGDLEKNIVRCTF
jgi:hypothetical protein